MQELIAVIGLTIGFVVIVIVLALVHSPKTESVNWRSLVFINRALITESHNKTHLA